MNDTNINTPAPDLQGRVRNARTIYDRRVRELKQAEDNKVAALQELKEAPKAYEDHFRGQLPEMYDFGKDG